MRVSTPGNRDEFQAKVSAARRADEQCRLERLAQLRDEDRTRLANQRLHRERVNINNYRARLYSTHPASVA